MAGKNGQGTLDAPKGTLALDAPKPKARRMAMSQLLVLEAFARTTKTGKDGFFGKVVDPATGIKYQVTLAVKIG